jgi:hypothetical protein
MAASDCRQKYLLQRLNLFIHDGQQNYKMHKLYKERGKKKTHNCSNTSKPNSKYLKLIELPKKNIWKYREKNRPAKKVEEKKISEEKEIKQNKANHNFGTKIRNINKSFKKEKTIIHRTKSWHI